MFQMLGMMFFNPGQAVFSHISAILCSRIAFAKRGKGQ